MRSDLPEPIRRELDAQRRAFCREVGAGYERLIEQHIDPTPWMVAVIALLEQALNDDGVAESSAA